jgi:hypothetical protein
MNQDGFQGFPDKFTTGRKRAQATAHADINIGQNSIELVVTIENVGNQGIRFKRGIRLRLQMNLHVSLSF